MAFLMNSTSICNAGICNSLIKKRKDHSNQSGGQECAECNAIEIPMGPSTYYVTSMGGGGFAK